MKKIKAKAASIKKKVLAHTLYTYVGIENNSWVRTQAKKIGLPYSKFLNEILTGMRVGKIKLNAAVFAKPLKPSKIAKVSKVA